MNEKLLRRFILYQYRYYIVLAITLLISILIYFSDIDSLGYHHSEIKSGLASLNISQVNLDESLINLPYRFMQQLSILLLGSSKLALNLPSIVMGLGSVGFIALLLKNWYTQRTALMGSIIFVTSSWLIGFARFGDPTVTPVFFVSALFYFITKLRETKTFWWFLLAGIIAGISAYTPGMIYLLIPLLAMSILAAIQAPWLKDKRRIAVSIITFLVVSAPLITSIVMHSSVWTVLAGPLDWNLALDPVQLVSNIGSFVMIIFIKAEGIAKYFSNAVGLLDIFSSAMFVLGVMMFVFDYHAKRSQLYLGSLLLVLFISGLSKKPDLALSMMLPLVYIAVSLGIRTMLVKWQQTFPRNPIARIAGSAVMLGVIFIVAGFHINKHFRARPATPETSKQFSAFVSKLEPHLSRMDNDIHIIVANDFEKEGAQFVLQANNINADISTEPPQLEEQNPTIVLSPETTRSRPELQNPPQEFDVEVIVIE